MGRRRQRLARPRATVRAPAAVDLHYAPPSDNRVKVAGQPLAVSAGQVVAVLKETADGTQVALPQGDAAPLIGWLPPGTLAPLAQAVLAEDGLLNGSGDVVAVGASSGGGTVTTTPDQPCVPLSWNSWKSGSYQVTEFRAERMWPSARRFQVTLFERLTSASSSAVSSTPNCVWISAWSAVSGSRRLVSPLTVASMASAEDTANEAATAGTRLVSATSARCARSFGGSRPPSIRGI